MKSFLKYAYNGQTDDFPRTPPPLPPTAFNSTPSKNPNLRVLFMITLSDQTATLSPPHRTC